VEEWVRDVPVAKRDQTRIRSCGLVRKWQGAKKRQRAGWIEERKEDGAFMGVSPIYGHIGRGPSSSALQQYDLQEQRKGRKTLVGNIIVLYSTVFTAVNNNF